MKMLMSILVTSLIALGAQAQERFEVGIGAGNSHPVNGDDFRTAASTGDGHQFWLGYGLDENWAVEIGLDNFDFDVVDSKSQAILLGGVYRFYPTSFIHPLLKFGLASVESENALSAKTTSMGVKGSVGLEADFKYISLGALFNMYHVQKTDDTANFENTQVMVPSLFITLHNAFSGEEKASPSEAPAATSAPATPAKEVKDTDNDGINDDDDKCPNTPSNVVVNKIGCSEKENASVKLNVQFAVGKSDLASDSSSEIENLAGFMKRFPETKVEIAGHTDSLGDAKRNQTLSQRRADSVKSALVNAGVEESRLTAVGYGSSRPVADNKTKAGRDQNRRVTAEISIDVDKKK